MSAVMGEVNETGLRQTQLEERKIMGFKNEKISEQDREWVAKLVNYDSIRAISRWVHKFDPPDWIWTANHERNAYLISLGGGGTPDDIGRMPYAVLILDGQIVVFNLVRKGTGDGAVGLHVIYEVHELVVPPDFEHRQEEIKQLLREALEEHAHRNPFADGGTAANPNMTARWNIKSVNVEFE